MIVNKAETYRKHNIYQVEKGGAYHAYAEDGVYVMHGTEDQCKQEIDALYTKYKRS